LISGVGAGAVEVIVIIIRALTGGVNAGALTPEQMRQLTQIGMDPQTLRFLIGPGGAALTGAMCCLGSLAIGAVLGAIGGVILGAAKRD
jgi:hypothetical protein